MVYLILWIYGMAIDLDTAANFVSLNTADNWLHFGLGVAMIGLGLVLPRAAPPSSRPSRTPMFP